MTEPLPRAVQGLLRDEARRGRISFHPTNDALKVIWPELTKLLAPSTDEGAPSGATEDLKRTRPAVLGYDLALKAMREGLTVRIKPSLHRGAIEGVPISVEDDYCLLDVSGCGTGDPSCRICWNELDRFQILPGDDSTPEIKRWTLKGRRAGAPGMEWDAIEVDAGEFPIPHGKSVEVVEASKYDEAVGHLEEVEKRLATAQEELEAAPLPDDEKDGDS